MNRRSFLSRASAVGFASLSSQLATHVVEAADVDKDVKITRVVGFTLPTRRRFLSPNTTNAEAT